MPATAAVGAFGRVSRPGLTARQLLPARERSVVSCRSAPSSLLRGRTTTKVSRELSVRPDSRVRGDQEVRAEFAVVVLYGPKAPDGWNSGAGTG